MSRRGPFSSGASSTGVPRICGRGTAGGCALAAQTGARHIAARMATRTKCMIEKTRLCRPAGTYNGRRGLGSIPADNIRGSMAGFPRLLGRSAPQRAPMRVRESPPLSPDDSRIDRALLAGLEHPTLLSRALHCAKVQNVPALDALIACTGADPESVTERLAARLGIEQLVHMDFPPDTLPANAASAALQAGLLRLPDGRFITALRGRAVIELFRLLQSAPHAAPRMLIASPAMFTRAVLHAAGESMAEEAAAKAERVDPAFTARSPALARLCAAVLGITGIAAIAATLTAPVTASLIFGTVFLMLTGLRL